MKFRAANDRGLRNCVWNDGRQERNAFRGYEFASDFMAWKCGAIPQNHSQSTSGSRNGSHCACRSAANDTKIYHALAPMFCFRRMTPSPKR